MIKQIDEIEPARKYLARIGATASGLFHASIREVDTSKYWTETVKIRFARDGKVTVTKGFEAFLPNEIEQGEIIEAFATAEFPKSVFKKNPPLPDNLKTVDKETVFTFLNENGETVMLQHRIETEDGKKYLPYSLWSDGEWRTLEPDLPLLPLYGLETCKGKTTAFLSEGAKAARAVARLIDPKTKEEEAIAADFPWREQFGYAASVGFIGGALAPERTDFQALKRLGIQRVIIICDNDQPGVDGVPKISSAIDLPCYAIRFSNQWPKAFDLADKWPETMFRKIGEKSYYVGPSFFDCLKPATFLTKATPYLDEKGKPKIAYTLRHHAKNSWYYVASQGLFVSADFPQIQLSPDRFEATTAPFVHRGVSASSLILQEYSCQIDKIAYRPDKKERTVVLDGELTLNVFQPTSIVGKAGDITPFLEYLEYLIPDKTDRKELIRWMATLVSKPEVRLLYGVLLISENTGVGKSILAERILTPLVGEHNVSFPSEETIFSQFSGWVAKKRLIVVSELYSGTSWKMSNRLKSYVTDRKITYNEKFREAVVLDNFATFLASSNSSEPLKLDSFDRRWYIPGVTEVRWPDSRFDELLDWLDAGGISIIKWYFDHYNDYVRSGEKAPKSGKKTEIVESARSPATNRCFDLAYKIRESGEPIAIGDKDLHAWLRAIIPDKIYDSSLELRKALKSKGLVEAKGIVNEGRFFINNQSQIILLSEKAVEKVKKIVDDGERRAYIKSVIKSPSVIMGGNEERM